MKNYQKLLICILVLLTNSQIPAQTDWKEFVLPTVGKECIYKVYDIDKDLNNISDDYWNASTKILRTFPYLDTLRYEMAKFREGELWARDFWFNMVGSKLYVSGNYYAAHFAFSDDKGAKGPQLSKFDFILFADFEEDNWESFETSFINFNIKPGVVYNGSYRIYGEKGETSRMNISGEEYDCLEIIQYVEFIGTISINSETDIPVDYTCEYHTICAVDYGWVKWYWFYPERDWGYGDLKYNGTGYTFDCADCDLVSDVLDKESDIENTTISPNPFSQLLITNYELRMAGRVSLKIYDVMGNEVAMLVDGWKETGSHQASFDGCGLPAGMYFYIMQSGDRIESGKMVKIE